MDSRRLLAFTLLAAANLMWSGNWVLGRALRETFDPIALNFWRWQIAALVMAPFALPQALANRALIVEKGAGARKTVEERFDWSKKGEALMAIYEQVLGRRAARGESKLQPVG